MKLLKRSLFLSLLLTGFAIGASAQEGGKKDPPPKPKPPVIVVPPKDPPKPPKEDNEKKPMAYLNGYSENRSIIQF